MENNPNNIQTNPTPIQSKPNVTAPIVQTPPTPTSEPKASSTELNIKVLSIKNLLIILGVAIVYGIANNIIGLISFVLFIIAMIYAYTVVSGIKKDISIVNEDSEKYRAVALMSISPVVVQAFYYYRLRKINPQIAGEYNKLGWKVLGILILLYIVVATILVLTIFPHAKSAGY